MNGARAFVAVFGLAAVVLAIILLWPLLHPVGFVTLDVNAPDSENMTVRINQARVADDSLQENYRVHPGSQSLTIEKPGYEKFTVQFTVKRNRTVVINANLKSAVTTSVEDRATQLTQYLAARNYAVQSLQYFYDNTWAFVTIDVGGDTGHAVVKYVSTTNTWKFALSPGSFFSSSDVGDLPKDVVNYMTQNGYVSEGAQ
jgi:hypothetical protein